jgi:hypothetical protein
VGGCLCCSVKDNGVKAIEELMKRNILLETSGLLARVVVKEEVVEVVVAVLFPRASLLDREVCAVLVICSPHLCFSLFFHPSQAT